MKKILIAIVLMCSYSASAFAESEVIATIKPLHSLVAAIMYGDSNKPVLLVDGKNSIHNFALKPSQVAALQKAAVVFYIGDNMEMFMPKTLASLPETVRIVPMEKLQGISRLPVRKNDHEEADHDENAHNHGAYDLHLWLSPQHTKVMAMEIGRQLAIAFPGKKEIYFANLKTLGQRLDALDEEMIKRMGKLQGKRFVSFHDATQYFDGIYGLAYAGSLTLHPEHGISAKRASDVRKMVEEKNIACVFRDPQFDAKVIDNLLAGTKAKSSAIDPEGALLTPGAELYFQMMEGLAASFETCLAP